MALTTREISLLVWGGVLVAWGCTKANIRRSIGELIKAALDGKLVAPFVVLVLCLGLVVAGLWFIGIWKIALLKDTVVFALFSGVGLTFSAMSRNPELPTWRSVLAGQLKTVVLVEYVVDTFTFALWIELLLVPTLSFIGLMGGVAATREKWAPVAKLAKGLMGVAGLAVVAFAGRNAIVAARTVSIADTLREVGLPLVLSLALLPIVQVFFLWSGYDQLFGQLESSRWRDRSVIRYGRRQMVRRLGVRTEAMRALLRTERRALMAASSEGDIDELLDRVLRRQEREPAALH